MLLLMFCSNIHGQQYSIGTAENPYLIKSVIAKSDNKNSYDITNSNISMKNINDMKTSSPFLFMPSMSNKPQVAREINFPSSAENESEGTITIRKVFASTNELLSNATFMVTPNPYTLNGSLVAHDNDGSLDSNPISGIIVLKNAKFSSYQINETRSPSGFGPILLKARISVHKTTPDPVVTIENRNLRVPFTGPTKVLAPYLNESSFSTFTSKGATIGKASIQKVNDLPAALMVTSEKQISGTNKMQIPQAITFREPINETASAAEIYRSLKMPIYPAPVKAIASNIIYVSPVFVIGQQEVVNHRSSNNSFVVTPIIAKVFPNMTLLVNHNSSVASGLTKIEKIHMQFAKNGTNVGFSFGISDLISKSLKLPPAPVSPLALFLNIDYIGKGGAGSRSDVNFYAVNSFKSSPQINILVSKSINTITKFADGCPDIRLFSFNEFTNKWQKLSNPARIPLEDVVDQCGYALKTQHFSKFAVGGIKPPTSFEELVQ